MTKAMIDTSRRPLVTCFAPGRLLIGGHWRDGERGESYPSINPATEQPAATIALGTASDLDEAVRAARTAFDEGSWPKMSGVERGKALNRVAELIEVNLESLAIRQVAEMGKNIRQSRLEVQGMAEVFRYHAGWASKLDGAIRHVPGGFHCFVVLEPVGVVAAITPFNVPLYLAATKAAPALAAGNVFIHKPSDTASISALRLAELIQEAGVPEGVYSVITGNGRELGQVISAHRGIDKIAFTGSTKTGIDIVQRSAPTLKKVTMELARIIHRTARNRPRPPNTWARDFIAKNFIKQPIRIVVNDIKGLALTAHFS